ncbi:hypothetical protein [Methanosarcina acetivorans]|uniref:Uncharacterized protein n=1 Tax=Methanosarcina acetivorans (strain ATCC 35395 / DSM 2834 / JCM 12185 / C2A) TaxID=188937 RepID=Q8TU22_METAC|nr:hypothetical protein [Methanosarcina acetivorans]AAM03705.1 predicted protein [Methanosarcina acetivorans C2A]
MIFLLKSKQDIFRKFSSSGCRVRKSPGSGKGSLHDSLMWSCPVIDADFVEVCEASDDDDSPELDPELIENLREYLRTRSEEEITEIFEEIRKILESRTSEGRFSGDSMGGSSACEKIRMKEIPGRAFRTFTKTASCGKARVIKISKTVSSKASTIASGGKESVKVSSKKLNDRWSNLSPNDRKMISEVLITVIEIGLLRNSSKGRRAAFVVLSSIYRHQPPGRKDLEEFIDEVNRRFKRRH